MSFLHANERGVFLGFLDGAFDLFFFPFRTANPVYGLTAISLLTGVTTIMVFRYASNQAAMRRTRDRIQAHVLEVRLFPDQLGVVLRAFGRILRFTLLYLVYTLKPLLVLLIPMGIVMSQLSLRFSRMPLRPHDSFILKAELADPIGPMVLNSNLLRLPASLTVTAPPVCIPALREVDWRIRADAYGDFALAITIADQVFEKKVVVSNEITQVPSERSRSSVLGWLLNPGEPSLPRRGPLQAIEVNYAPRSIDLRYFETDWLVFFLAVSLISGLIAKVLLRIEV